MKTATTLLLFLSILHFTGTAQVTEQDSLALVAFYNSTGGPNWNNNSNWLTGPVSSWYGVTVEGETVLKLIMYSNNLQGEIPSEVCNLTELTDLNLGHDSGLIGELPIEIGQLSQLQGLFIGYCSLSGTIPNFIGNCTRLNFIQLMKNNLTGPIPPEIGNLDSLIFLDLHDNQLSSSIPPELGDCDNLQELWLNDNQLTGTIPEEVSYLDNLQILNVNNNQLSGELPEYLSNLFYQTSPFYISLFVSGNQFSGPVPEAWGNTSFLIDALDLSYNQFTSLPNVSSNWIMTFFNINDNKLTFESIESHYQSYQQGLYYFFDYSPQDDLLTEIDTALAPGSNYSIYSGTGGQFTHYQWFKNGELILEGTQADSLHLIDITAADAGVYTCVASNSLIYFLTLTRRPVQITIDTTQSINRIRPKPLLVYPNPAHDRINIKIPDTGGPVDILILDLTGRCHKAQHVELSGNSVVSVDITGLMPGLYFLQIQTNSTTYKQKIIKANRTSAYKTAPASIHIIINLLNVTNHAKQMEICSSNRHHDADAARAERTIHRPGELLTG